MPVTKSPANPAAKLEVLARSALDVAKRARKQRKSLGGDNYYGNKLLDLRAQATQLFGDLAGSLDAGETTALAELIQGVFSADTSMPSRQSAFQHLAFELKTRRANVSIVQPPSDAVIPLTMLAETRRGYLLAIGRQVNGTYDSEWYDACAVMMRRLLETCIVEAFEGEGIADRIKVGDDYVQLTELINAALSETSWSLTRNTRQHLPRFRDLGHMSAHSRRYTARRPDIEPTTLHYRAAIEEFLHLAKLL